MKKTITKILSIIIVAITVFSAVSVSAFAGSSRATYNDVFASTKGKGYSISQGVNSASSSFPKGTYIYVWAWLHDKNGNLYSSYSNGRCNMTISIYRPNGTCQYTYTYNGSDNNWIGTQLTVEGTYIIESKITGSLTGTNQQKIVCTSTPSNVQPNGISISRSSVTLNKGNSVVLAASVSPKNASNKSVTWSTSNSLVATVNAGKVTAKKPGKCTITAKTSNGIETHCTVCVKGITYSQPIAITACFAGDKWYAKKPASYGGVSTASLTWSSSNSSIASVNSSGLITAKKEGNATITAKTADGYTACFSVIVSGTTKKQQGFFGSSDPVKVRLNKGCSSSKIKIQCKGGNGIDFNNEFIVTLRDKNGNYIWRGTVKSPATLTLGNDHSEYYVYIQRKNLNNPIYISNTFEWIVTCTSNCFIM